MFNLLKTRNLLAGIALASVSSMSLAGITTFDFTSDSGNYDDCATNYYGYQTTTGCSGISYTSDGVNLDIFGAVWNGSEMDTTTDVYGWYKKKKRRGWKWKYGLLEEDGYDVTVSEYSNGLGVTSSYYDSHVVDGRGHQDYVVFEFDQEVELSIVDFSYFNPDRPDYDDARIYSYVDDAWSEIGTFDSDPLNLGGLNLVGTTFAIGAPEKNDDFKIKSLTVEYHMTSPGGVTPVPEPSTFVLLGLGLTILVVARRGSFLGRAS